MSCLIATGASVIVKNKAHIATKAPRNVRTVRRPGSDMTGADATSCRAVSFIAPQFSHPMGPKNRDVMIALWSSAPWHSLMSIGTQAIQVEADGYARYVVERDGRTHGVTAA